MQRADEAPGEGKGNREDRGQALLADERRIAARLVAQVDDDLRVRPGIGRLCRGHRDPLALRVVVRKPFVRSDHERVRVIVSEEYGRRLGRLEVARGRGHRTDAVVEIERGEHLGDRGMQEPQALVGRHLSG